jgi:FtsH-binding integral membrane protein
VGNHHLEPLCQVTFGVVLTFTAHKSSVLPFMRGPQGSAILTTSMLGSVFTMMMFAFRPSLQSTSPANFLLLGLFTLFESILVGSITLMYAAPSVMLAIAQTVRSVRR